MFLSSGRVFWAATERLGQLKASREASEALREIVRGRLEALGPVTVDDLGESFELDLDKIQYALSELETEGFVFRGRFTPGLETEEWCERRLLQRIHRYSIESLRQSIQPVSVQDFMRFLFARHHLNYETQGSGPAALQYVLELVEGYQAPASSWESDLIPSRLTDYDPLWLDMLCMSGKVTWGRFNLPQGPVSKSSPVKSTPISLIDRGHESLWRTAAKGEIHIASLSKHAQKIREFLKANGASFF